LVFFVIRVLQKLNYVLKYTASHTRRPPLLPQISVSISSVQYFRHTEINPTSFMKVDTIGRAV